MESLPLSIRSVEVTTRIVRATLHAMDSMGAGMVSRSAVGGSFAVGRSRVGFTILELLVVVAIMGILAALLMPSMNRMNEGSLRSRAQSNLRQLSTFFTLYAGEHDGTLPPSWNGSQHWLTEFQASGYLPAGAPAGLWLKARVLECPAMNKRDGKDNKASFTSFAMNSSIGLPAASANQNMDLWKVTQTSVPSKVFLLFDGIYAKGTKLWTSVYYPGSVDIRPPYHNNPALNDGDLNILYLDGHVESHKAVEIPPLIWHSPVDDPGNIAWRGGREW